MSGSDSHKLPVRPQINVNAFEDEVEDREQEDSEKVVMEDVEYEGWIEGPTEEGGAEAEEPLKRKVVQGVKTPSRLEVEDHEKLHIPFKTWCKSCVKGRGQASPHFNVIRDDPESPEVIMDYCFPRAEIIILGVRDSLTGATASILVFVKGGNITWIV